MGSSHSTTAPLKPSKRPLWTALTPLLLQPRLFGVKNACLKSGKRGVLRSITALLVPALMYGMYRATLHGLHSAQINLSSPPLTLLAFITTLLSALFVMMYLSASVNALSALFLARDLELTLSAPLTSHQFLSGKVINVGISVSWMLTLFGLPALLALGSFSEAGIVYTIAAPALCLCFFSLAVLLGMITALCLAAVIPSERGKYLLLITFLLAVGAVVFFLNGTPLRIQTDPSSALPLLLQSMIPLASSSWFPSALCAQTITALAAQDTAAAMLPSLKIGLAAISLWATVRFTYNALFERGLERTHSPAGGPHSILSINSRTAQLSARLLLPLASPVTRAIVSKEYKLFSRDITHTVQLGLLMGVTLIYLFNYQNLHCPQNTTPEACLVWSVFLLLTNMTLGSLVVVSICSRFVYPSLSLEGGSFWLLQSAPIDLREALRAKFKGWFVPLACIAAVVYSSGAMALDVPPELVLTSAIAGILLCYGLVALGIGMGAIFSQFDWEHPAQLSMSFGSFLFMIGSMLFLSLNLLPLGIALSIYHFLPDFIARDGGPMFLFGTTFLVLYSINRLTAWWALSLGARALR